MPYRANVLEETRLAYIFQEKESAFWRVENPVDLCLYASSYGWFFPLLPPPGLLGLDVEVEVDGAFWAPARVDVWEVLVAYSFVVFLEVAMP